MPKDKATPSSDTPSLRARLFGGTLWMFAMRWSGLLLSVISLTVLARLLEKADFGLVAIASAAIALPTVISDLGVEQAIIRERLPEPGIYNTAWTIRAIQMTFAAACIYLAGPWIADFYGDPRLAEMLPVLAVAVMLSGMENLWTVSFRKDFKFRRDFAYNLTCKLVAVIATIVLAVVLRSYWALVYGQVAAAALRLTISLFITPEWPRPTLSHWRRIWSFSQWSLVRSLAGYIVAHGDRLVLGRLVTADAIGAYSIGREIAEMPISEISAPVNRALGPGFSKLQREPQRLAQALTKSLGAVATVTFPIAIGLAVTAGQLIPVLLGDGWTAAIPILQILAFASMISAVRGVMGNTLAVIGYIRSSAIVMWVRGLLLIAIGIPGAIFAGAEGMAGSFLVSEGLAICVTFFSYRRHLPQFKLGSLGLGLVRPGVSTLVMFSLVVMIDQTGIVSLFLLLVCKVVIGVLSYGTTLYVLWRCAGRPEGLERTVLQHLNLPRKIG